MPRLSDGFVGDVVTLASPIGPLLVGVVDADAPGIAEAVSHLLMRSIQDAREENEGHLPSWLVDDIERNYISPAKVRTLWAATGHRFAVITGDGSEMVATVHVARRSDTILTIDRHRINVPASDHPGFKPEGHHHVVNLSVKHEIRRAGIGTLMFDAIVSRFRGLFDGEGLWVRADPPWHAGLVGLGFEHDPSMDVFLPETAARTAGLPHEVFNRIHACACAPAAPARPDALAERARSMLVKKLQYVSFTRPFAPRSRTTGRRADAVPPLDGGRALLETYATDWSRRGRVVPRAVARPASVRELSALLAWASRERRSVAVRGAGFSAAGQCASDDVVLSTERLAEVVAVRPDRVVVQAGATWDAVLEATRRRKERYPPVIPGWLPATIGGTLSTGGFSKGSWLAGYVVDHVLSLVVVTGNGRIIACSRTQAGWLFDAVLAGHGLFGVIAEATLRIEPRRRFVRVRAIEIGDAASLAEALEAEPAAYHVAAFAAASGGWTLVRAWEQDEPGDEPFASFVTPRPQGDTEKGPRTMLQLLVPRRSLALVLTRARKERPDATMQIHPVRQERHRRHGLLLAEVDGDVAFMVTITTSGSASLDGIASVGRELGAVPTLLGGPPTSWASYLGDRRLDRVVRAKKMADPAGVLGAKGWRLPT